MASPTRKTRKTASKRAVRTTRAARSKSKRIAGVPAVALTEGAAKLWVPGKSFGDLHHENVFFNPAMRFSRTLSSRAVGALASYKENLRNLEFPLDVVDGLCATGSRGLRYLLENPAVVGKVFFAEANPPAVSFLRENLTLNKVKKGKVAIWEDDLNQALVAAKRRFDFVEIDPFGSPVFFLDSAIRRLKKSAILSITSTDLASLTGARPMPAIRHYDAKPLRNSFSHETVVRILLGRIARSLAVHDFACKPLLCWYEGHYAKCMVLAVKHVPDADETLANLGFVHFDERSGERAFSKQNFKVNSKDSSWQTAGPLWVSDVQDFAFLKHVSARNDAREVADEVGRKEQARVHDFLALLEGEKGFPPFFWDVGVEARRGSLNTPKLDLIIERLRQAGFRVARTHYEPTALKIDARASVAHVQAAIRG